MIERIKKTCSLRKWCFLYSCFFMCITNFHFHKQYVCIYFLYFSFVLFCFMSGYFNCSYFYNVLIFRSFTLYHVFFILLLVLFLFFFLTNSGIFTEMFVNLYIYTTLLCGLSRHQ